jgi:hypothetical protein
MLKKTTVLSLLTFVFVAQAASLASAHCWTEIDRWGRSHRVCDSYDHNDGDILLFGMTTGALAATTSIDATHHHSETLLKGAADYLADGTRSAEFAMFAKSRRAEIAAQLNVEINAWENQGIDFDALVAQQLVDSAQ